jgi:hypothetical protein
MTVVTLTHPLPIRPTRVDGRLVLAGATLAAGLLVLAFWALYLTEAATLGQADPLRANFEAAFPFADVVFAGVLLATGVLLLKRHAGAPFFLVIAASMSVYLGILDVTFYARHGLYSPLTADAATELVINLLCIGGGLAGLKAGWRLWRAS